MVNTSEYTLLTGQASVFVDGSFIAKANMPAVNPQEKFDYSLGCVEHEKQQQTRI